MSKAMSDHWREKYMATCKDFHILKEALKFYADVRHWKKERCWTGSAGFGEEPDDRQPYDSYPIIEADSGRRARNALKSVGESHDISTSHGRGV